MVDRHGCVPPYVVSTPPSEDEEVCQLGNMTEEEQRRIMDDYHSEINK